MMCLKPAEVKDSVILTPLCVAMGYEPLNAKCKQTADIASDLLLVNHFGLILKIPMDQNPWPHLTPPIQILKQKKSLFKPQSLSRLLKQSLNTH